MDAKELAKSLQVDIEQVQSDLKSRPDYDKFKSLSACLDEYTGMLMQLVATRGADTSLQKKVVNFGQSEVLPALSKLVDENLDMSKMGQLNTARVVAPSVLLKQNQAIEALRLDIQKLNAILDANNQTTSSGETPSNSLSPVVDPGRSGGNTPKKTYDAEKRYDVWFKEEE
ncbi:hypothetical protein [Kordiimonas sp.]|uniref:hypothetical protein n=1 Tax=Kordiimonas sp. TaxID=1970157 RepID=UPI003A95CDAB